MIKYLLNCKYIITPILFTIAIIQALSILLIQFTPVLFEWVVVMVFCDHDMPH